MQNPDTGALVPVPDDDPKNVPPDWQMYAVGQRLKTRGWWWEITDISFDEHNEGRLTIKPIKRAAGDSNEEDDPRTALSKALSQSKSPFRKR
jgi:hypothetical protein